MFSGENYLVSPKKLLKALILLTFELKYVNKYLQGKERICSKTCRFAT